MQIRTIATEAELDELIESSRTAPVLLFKHSNACPISSNAHSQVDRFLSGESTKPFTAAMLVVQDSRSLSNSVAERLSIRHETPQAIVLRDAAPVWNASHWDITESALAKALAEA